LWLLHKGNARKLFWELYVQNTKAENVLQKLGHPLGMLPYSMSLW
jgi:hypothetical protein